MNRDEDALRDEYPDDLIKSGARGKYVNRYREGTNVVLIGPDLHELFPEAELKIDFGPGYRVYYTQRGTRLILLLAGGEKSTQQSDIKMAIRLARNFQE